MDLQLRVRREGSQQLPVLLWRFSHPMRAIASSPHGGGLGVRRWVVNAQVPPSYARRDPDHHLGIEWHTLGDGFTWESTDMDETIAKGRHAWSVAADKLASGDYQLLILDELTYAVKYGWVDVDDVVTAVRDRAPKTNVVITGRDAPDEIVALADTVTEMRKIKHAYDEGIKAIKGIEY